MSHDRCESRTEKFVGYDKKGNKIFEVSKKALLLLCERTLKNLDPKRMSESDLEMFEEVAKFYAALKFRDVAFRITENTDEFAVYVEYRFPTSSSIENKIESPAQTVYLPTTRILDEMEKESCATRC